MLDAMFEDKLVKFSVLGATGFNIFLSAVSALNRLPVNKMGFLSIILGVLCILAVVSTSRYIPFLGPLLVAIIIYLPGAFIGALVKVVLMYGIAVVIASPFIYFIEVITAVFPWFFL